VSDRERIERGGARVTRSINGCRRGLHALHNSQVLRNLSAIMPSLAEKLRKMLHDWRGKINAAMPERA